MIKNNYQPDGVICSMPAHMKKGYSMDDIVGNYPQCDIECHYNPAYGSTCVASKSELQALCMSLWNGRNTVLME